MAAGAMVIASVGHASAFDFLDVLTQNPTRIAARHHPNSHRVRYGRHPSHFSTHWRAEAVAIPNARALAIARHYAGSSNPTHFRGPWCGAFAGMVARAAHDYVPSGFRRAIAWLHAGPHVHNPQPGDAAVMHHHVTFFVGYGGRGFYGLGGNQGHRVRLSSYPVGRVIAWVRLRGEGG